MAQYTCFFFICVWSPHVIRCSIQCKSVNPVYIFFVNTTRPNWGLYIASRWSTTTTTTTTTSSSTSSTAVFAPWRCTLRIFRPCTPPYETIPEFPHGLGMPCAVGPDIGSHWGYHLPVYSGFWTRTWTHILYFILHVQYVQYSVLYVWRSVSLVLEVIRDEKWSGVRCDEVFSVCVWNHSLLVAS